MGVVEIRWLKQLEDEHAKLERLVRTSVLIRRKRHCANG
jgi:hypothetical protein